MELIEVVTVLTIGALFGGFGGILELRRPMKNCAIKPCGSSEKLNPIGNPCEVTGLVVLGTTIRP
jgi:hypothetical protein